MGERVQRPRILTGYIPTVKEADKFSDNEENIPYDDRRYTVTKFGGLNPFFNPGAQWPLCKSCGRPQTFVGQINLLDKKVPLPIRETLGVGGGEGIFQLFWCPDDGMQKKACRWRFDLQDRISAFFVTPKPSSKDNLPSLVGLAARRIADEILEEDPLVVVLDHPSLVDLPEHLQTLVKTLVEGDRAEKNTMKQREYCISALGNVKKFLAFDHRDFDPTASSKGTPPWDDRETDDDLGEEESDDEDERNRSLYFLSNDMFDSWKEYQVEVDQAEADYTELFDIQDTHVDGTRVIDGNSYLPGKYLFLGWPRWNPFTVGEYPVCPNDPKHGVCYEPILVSYAVEALDSMLQSDGGWLLLLKCPVCPGFGVTDENPCLH